MTGRTPRRGFTLVELLVAVALAIVILSLAVYVVNSATFESYKVVGAGDRLSQWLMQAKNRALRDKSPRGLRLFVDPATNRVTECAFIEQPEPWLAPAGAAIQFDYRWDPNATPPQFTEKRVYLTGVTPGDFDYDSNNDGKAGDFPNATIRPGDIVSVPEIGYLFRIVLIRQVQGSATSVELFLDNPVTNSGGPGTPPTGFMSSHVAMLPDLGAAHSRQDPNNASTWWASYQTANFGIHRQPQLLLGEPTMQLQTDMAVDVALSREGSTSTPTVTGSAIDVVFTPGGEVMSTTQGYYIFLLRNVKKMPNAITLPADFDSAGEMVLVAVYTRTGAIATHPVANDPDPYRFAKDAINTGL